MGWMGSEETPPQPAPGGGKRDLGGMPIPGAGVLGGVKPSPLPGPRAVVGWLLMTQRALGQQGQRLRELGSLLPWPTWAVQRLGEGGGGSGKEVGQGAVCDSESPAQARGERGTTEGEGPRREKGHMTVRGKQLQLSPWEHDSGHHGKASRRRALPVSGSTGQSC